MATNGTSASNIFIDDNKYDLTQLGNGELAGIIIGIIWICCWFYVFIFSKCKYPDHKYNYYLIMALKIIAPPFVILYEVFIKCSKSDI
jgi:hypothetical protein